MISMNGGWSFWPSSSAGRCVELRQVSDKISTPLQLLSEEQAVQGRSQKSKRNLLVSGYGAMWDFLGVVGYLSQCDNRMPTCSLDAAKIF